MSMLMKMITNGHSGPMIMRKGGGGGGTSTSGIAPEFKPALMKGLGYAEGQLDKELKGGDGIAYADQAKAQQALGVQERLAQDALQGRGAFDNQAAINNQLDRVAAQSRLSHMGAPSGSARAQRAQASALADAALQMQQMEQQQQAAGAQALQTAAMQGRALEQERLDAPHKSLDRYFGYLSGAPQQSTTKQSGGK